jgi:hypothetical protein
VPICRWRSTTRFHLPVLQCRIDGCRSCANDCNAPVNPSVGISTPSPWEPMTDGSTTSTPVDEYHAFVVVPTNLHLIVAFDRVRKRYRGDVGILPGYRPIVLLDERRGSQHAVIIAVSPIVIKQNHQFRPNRRPLDEGPPIRRPSHHRTRSGWTRSWHGCVGQHAQCVTLGRRTRNMSARRSESNTLPETLIKPHPQAAVRDLIWTFDADLKISAQA